MRQIIDMHVHSHYSMDSRMTIETICRTAIERGLSGVCVTDHVEHQPADIGYGRYDAERYFQEIDQARQKFGHKLKLLCGIEFSEPHLYPAAFEQYAKLPYDSIIGSVHYWIGSERVEDMVLNRPIEDAFEYYWRAVSQAVSLGGFTILGHVDFPRRFYKAECYSREILSEIFSLAVKNAIALEINTSSVRQGAGGPMPEQPIIEIYRGCGGRQACVGSDAHVPEHIGADLELAFKEAAGCTVGYFQNRQFQPLEAGLV